MSPRWITTAQKARDLAKIEQIIRTTGGDNEPVKATTRNHRNTPADARVLRMIPVTARGVAGTIPTTNPLDECLAREQRRTRNVRRTVVD